MDLTRPLLAFCLALMVAACGGPFKDAVKRGDQYASVGMWDMATADYEAARKIKPGDTDVTIKIKKVKQKQAIEVLSRGKALIARGEIEGGLAVIQQAAKLDPAST